MNMPQITVWFGVVLILLGVVGYVATGMVSVTALIPSFFGIVFVILGRLGSKENLRKHMMHVAAVLALLAVAGSFGGVLKLFTMLGGGDVARPAATISQAVMAVLSLGFVILCVKSFIDARRGRAAESA